MKNLCGWALGYTLYYTLAFLTWIGETLDEKEDKNAVKTVEKYPMNKKPSILDGL